LCLSDFVYEILFDINFISNFSEKVVQKCIIDFGSTFLKSGKNKNKIITLNKIIKNFIVIVVVIKYEIAEAIMIKNIIQLVKLQLIL
jgi:hypothetical protein